HKDIKNLIAFDIVRVTRENGTDNKLTTDEYENLCQNKMDVINHLTEHLSDDLKNRIREDLLNELQKSELLDRLTVGTSYKYEKGRIRQLSGKKNPVLKEQDMISLMQKA